MHRARLSLIALALSLAVPGGCTAPQGGTTGSFGMILKLPANIPQRFLKTLPV